MNYYTLGLNFGIVSFILIFLFAGCDGAKDGGTPGISWKDPIRVAEGPAMVGPWRMNQSVWDYVDDPSVDLRSDGSAGVAWVNQGEKNIYFQLYDSGRSVLNEQTNVSRTPGRFSWFPDVEILSDTPTPEVYVLWQEIVFSGGSHGGEIFFARSGDGGRTFDEPMNLSNSRAGDGKGRLTEERWDNGSLDLALGPDGNLYAAWTEYEGRLWFSYSLDGGRTFSEPILVSDEKGRPARGPSLGVGSGKNVHLVWTVGESDSADVHYQKLTPRGRLHQEPIEVNPSADHSDAPKVAVSDTDLIHLVWAVSPGGIGEAYQLLYSRRLPGDTAFRAPRKLSPDSSDHYESFRFPSLRLDTQGNPLILWELYPTEGRDRSKGLGLIRSTDQGASFETPGVIPATVRNEQSVNGSLQGQLMEKLDVGKNNQIVVVNSTFTPGVSSQVQLYRGRSKKSIK